MTRQEAATDVTVAQWEAMGDATRCWEKAEHRAGRTPTEAVVKWDGTVTVERVSAERAGRLSAQGEVWVLAWCE